MLFGCHSDKVDGVDGSDAVEEIDGAIVVG